MTLTEAKQYLGDSYVLSPNYRLEESPWHNLYEPVNVALTFQHVRRRDEREGDLPPFPLRIDEPTHTVGLWSGRDKTNCKPSVNKREFESTPIEFAKWLVEVARRCQP